KNALTNLIKPFSTTEETDINAASLKRIEAFRTAVGTTLSSEVQKEEVFNYAEKLRSALYEGAKNSTVTDLDPLYNEALEFYQDNPVPESAKDIIKKPGATEVSTIIKNI